MLFCVCRFFYFFFFCKFWFVFFRQKLVRDHKNTYFVNRYNIQLKTCHMHWMYTMIRSAPELGKNCFLVSTTTWMKITCAASRISHSVRNKERYSRCTCFSLNIRFHYGKHAERHPNYIETDKNLNRKSATICFVVRKIIFAQK